MMRLYLAGPLFTVQEREWNRDLAYFLRREGYDVFLPQEGEPAKDTGNWVQSIYNHDLSGLAWCGALLANLDGPVVDDGTAWECGWAVARGKPVYGYRTDFRGGERSAPVNVMLAASCTQLITVPSVQANHVGLTGAILNMLRD